MRTTGSSAPLASPASNAAMRMLADVGERLTHGGQAAG